MVPEAIRGYRAIRACKGAIRGYKGPIRARILEEALTPFLDGHQGHWRDLRSWYVMLASDFACLVQFPYLFFRALGQGTLKGFCFLFVCLFVCFLTPSSCPCLGNSKGAQERNPGPKPTIR